MASDKQSLITKGGWTIPAVVSLREAGRQLGRNPTYLKGLAEGLGIEIRMAGRTAILTERDLERLRRQIDRCQSFQTADIQVIS